MKRFADHFSEGARGYAAHRPTYPPELAGFLASAAPEPVLAWDCGCGSGQLSVPLGKCFQKVIATDASSEQIAHAAPHPNVEYRRAPAEASGLPDGVADAVVAAQAAHWFDLPGYYAEVRRVVRPGAIVALITYNLLSVDGPVDAVISHYYWQVLGTYWPPERRHVEIAYRSLSFPFAEMEVPPFEMRLRWRLADLSGYIETWSAVRAIEKAEGRAPVEAFQRDLARAWAAGPEERVVRWPLGIRAGRVAG